jgi:hypothetical protein
MPSNTPITLVRDISPPPPRRSRIERKTHAIEHNTTPEKTNITDDEPGPAAVEAGKASVKDHLAYFSNHLYRPSRQTPADFPRITLDHFKDLYTRNQHNRGCHFVVHQHDHPISGSFNGPPSLYSCRSKLTVAR